MHQYIDENYALWSAGFVYILHYVHNFWLLHGRLLFGCILLLNSKLLLQLEFAPQVRMNSKVRFCVPGILVRHEMAALLR